MSHLSILREKFPGKLVLDVADIAACLSLSRDHIYRLSSQKKLPFPVLVGLGDKIQVSIVAMANYLDGFLVGVPVAEPVKPDFVVKKKLGRPRGAHTQVSKLQLAFQGELKLAIVHYETEAAFVQLAEKIAGLTFDDNEKSETAKFNGLKDLFQIHTNEARIAAERSFVNVSISSKKPKKLRPFGI